MPLIFKNITYLLVLLMTAQLSTGQNKNNLSTKNQSDTLYLYIKLHHSLLKYDISKNKLDSLLISLNDSLSEKGYIFNSIIPDSIKVNHKTNIYYHINLNKKQTIDSIIIKNDRKTPSNIIKKLNKDFKNKTLNGISLKNLKNEVRKLKIEPETYTLNFKNSKNFIVIKNKTSPANKINAYLGFNYDQQNRQLNLEGEIETSLFNLFNQDEYLSLKWQKKQILQNFDWQYYWPWILGSNIHFNNHFLFNKIDTISFNIINESKLKFVKKNQSISGSFLYQNKKNGYKFTSTQLIGIGYSHSIKNKKNDLIINLNLKANIKNLSDLLFFAQIKHIWKFNINLNLMNHVQVLSNSDANKVNYVKLSPELLRTNIISNTLYNKIYSLKNELSFLNNQTKFYMIGDYINKISAEKLTYSYLNIGLGLEIFNKKQILTFEIIKPFYKSYLTDYQDIYINIKQSIIF